MIPRIIHFCWFGRGKKNKLIESCISSWERYLPDYEIMEWNEDNFDVSSNGYVFEAYKKRKWAFVSDFVRLYAIKEYGGIYLDTDVEVFRSFDKFLGHKAFTGFENYKGALAPITAVMAAEKGHPWVSRLIAEYDTASFRAADGTDDLTTNTIKITKILMNEYSVSLDDQYQILKDDLHLYPSNIFCNYKIGTSYSMHHFNGSWIPWQYKLRAKLKAIFKNKKY
ncbi:glycosyltransferase family 32 protein [Alcaligenes faecalis]|uniref:glycosyltransferase family 32 protein n=1 Tax=Alcaligenes faecalis TaxID=511 RepID=UPI001EF13703|nr:glycosyltransferase [Alcaligenes faecalis]ULH06408.1 hypothetical protein MF263_17270 [Alcaligenes faecalis]